jgi:cystathionine beta-synthase
MLTACHHSRQPPLSSMTIHSNVLELIGDTPMVKAQHLDSGCCELYLKLECMNPGGSIKDRIGLAMIEAAEAAGQIRPGDTLVEGTAGNTGIALALVAQQKGYRLILVVPDKMSREKIFNLKAMGAQVVLTRSDVGRGHPDFYIDRAEIIANSTPNAFFINQFGNPDNAKAHEQVTGPEIFEQMDRNMDAIVFGLGSSGTMTGLGRYFARVAPKLEMVLADPQGSILTQWVRDGTRPEQVGTWTVEGIGSGFIPDLADFSNTHIAYQISDRDSYLAGRELLLKEGILGGSSSGTIIAAALRYCREQTTPKRVVAFVCDTGNKYLSKMFNDYWMLDNGYLERPLHGDLRDLILRPYADRDTVVIGPGDTLTLAYQRMKLYDVSQLPVIDDGRIVGILDESDVLLHVYSDHARFTEPVASAMTTRLNLVDVRAPLESLMPEFEQGHVAIVMDGEQFLGLITRIDLLNYLRRRVQ